MTVAQVVKILPTFYATLRFITVLTTAATGPNPEPAEPGRHLTSYLLKIDAYVPSLQVFRSTL